MIRRARLTAVLAVLVAGVLLLIGSTQTWITVVLSVDTSAELLVAGADAVPVLAPISLAVLALGLALSIVGVVLRAVFGALALLAGLGLGVLALQVLTGPAISAFAPAVTDVTGITGDAAIGGMVSSATLSPWPAISLIAAAVLTIAGAFTIVTGRRWARGGRKYETAHAHAQADGDGPLDAIDSWDDLSRGEDPTSGSAAR